MTYLNKKHFYIYLIIVFFIFAHKVSANLEISDIMYDPDGSDTNREWVKLYNNGNEKIVIVSGRSDSAWRFSYDTDGTELHIINDSLSIDPGGYAVIASDKDTFVSEYPDFNGPVADTSMSLNNTSGVIRIWDGSSPRRLIAYKGYPASDNTGDNSGEPSDTSSNINSTSSSDASISNTSKKEEQKIYPITTKIIAPKIAVANIPFTIDHQTFGIHKEKIILGKFVWNFGDGVKEEFSVSNPFSHVYNYPGDYVVSLSFYDSILDKDSDAIDRLTIKVIPSGIAISSVGDTSDPFIEIYNNSSYEMSLRDWVIKGVVKSFVIPEGTIILPGKKIKLSPRVTGFQYSDLSYIAIIDNAGQVFATYPKNKNLDSYKYSNSSSVPNSYKILSDTTAKNTEDEKGDTINLNNIEASVVRSGNHGNLNYYAILAFVLVVGMGSIIMTRNHKKEDEDVDNEISVKDMKIVE